MVKSLAMEIATGHGHRVDIAGVVGNFPEFDFNKLLKSAQKEVNKMYREEMENIPLV